MTLRKILEGRWFGHPLHPLITHLPVGLWLLTLILDIASFSTSSPWQREGAGWAVLIGTAAAILAAILGVNDWLDIRDDHPAQPAALWHMGLLIPATAVFVIDTVLHFTSAAESPVTAIMLALSIVGYALAIVGGYLGGMIVYEDGIAVGRHRRLIKFPQSTIHEPRKGTTELPLAPHAGLPREFHPVVPDAALPEGGTLRVEIGGAMILLARTGGQVCAVQEFCTHRCGPLSEGTIQDGQVRCPWHGSCFDLATGKVAQGPAKIDLKTYETRIQGGIVHVKLPGACEQAAEPRASERRNPPESPPERAPRPEIPRRTPAS